MTKNIVKKVLLILFMPFVLALLGNGYSYAAETVYEFSEAEPKDEDGHREELVGNIYKLGFEFLSQTYNYGTWARAGSENDNYADGSANGAFYCVEHGISTGRYPQESGYRRLYSYVEIRGDVATAWTYQNGQAVERTPITNAANAKLAYIFGCSGYLYGYGTGSEDALKYYARQLALYRMFNSWHSTVGKNLGINLQDSGSPYNNASIAAKKPANTTRWSNYDNATSILNAAENVERVYITNNKSDTITSDNSFAGPFNVTFEGTISYAKIWTTNEENIRDNVKICDKNHNKIDIQSGVDFYIENRTGKTLNKIEIQVFKKVLGAQMWFFDEENSSQAQKQQLVYVRSFKNTEFADTTIYMEPAGSLTINKVDADTGEKLNAGFRIFREGGVNVNGKLRYWVKEDANGNITFVSSDKATQYDTPNGSVTIRNLPYGTYKVFEIAPPSGEYDLSNQAGNLDGDNGLRCVLDYDGGSWETINVDGNKAVTIKNKKNTRKHKNIQI